MRFGYWLMRSQDFDAAMKHADGPARLKEILALQNIPTHFSIVSLPKGTRLRIGTANSHESYGRGLGLQVEIMKDPNPDWFKTPIPIRTRRPQ